MFIGDTGTGDEIDVAYLSEYGSGSAVRSIMSPTATTTTLRVEPK